MNPLLKKEQIAAAIYLVRNQKVMLDRDLAELYRVETRALKQAVRRNADRFPSDFMFQLSTEEVDEMVSQNVIPSKSYLGGHSPYVFTQYECNMLATVLKTENANKRTVQIIRAFTVVEMMIQQGDQVSNSAHTVTSKMLKNIYSSLWVIKQGMSDSKGMQHYTTTLGTVMESVEGLIDGHVES